MSKKKIYSCLILISVLGISILTFYRYRYVNSHFGARPEFKIIKMNEKYTFENAGEQVSAKGYTIKVTNVEYLTQDELDKKYPRTESDNEYVKENFSLIDSLEAEIYILVETEIENTNDEVSEEAGIYWKAIQLDDSIQSSLPISTNLEVLNPKFSRELGFSLPPHKPTKYYLLYKINKNPNVNLAYFKKYPPKLYLQNLDSDVEVQLPPPLNK